MSIMSIMDTRFSVNGIDYMRTKRGSVVAIVYLVVTAVILSLDRVIAQSWRMAPFPKPGNCVYSYQL